MSVARREDSTQPWLPAPAARRGNDPLRRPHSSERHRRGRLVLAAIALVATLSAGLLFGAQRASQRSTQAPAAVIEAPPAVGGADSELQPAAPAPADAPRQIVQALAGRAGAAQAAPMPAIAALDAPASPAAVTADAAPAPSATADAAGAPSGADTDGEADADAAGVAAGRAYAGAAPVPQPSAQPATAIVWPARGPITSLFGPQHPLGIDIGIPLGTIVRAMADGRVAFAGGNACCSYGYYVDIDHGDGIMTRYGHLLYVPALAVGQLLHAGDPIGLSGSTGNSTGPHLHFEIRLHGLPVNPLLVLPR